MRYPWEPLQAILDARLGEITRGNQQVVGPNDVRRAELLGVHHRQVHRWRGNGIAPKDADRLAVRLGLLPYDVWPEMLEDAISDVERRCEADGCEATFVPLIQNGPKRQRYCSATCRQRMRMRRYRSNPDAARRHRERQRRYNAEVAEARRQRQARRVAA